LDEGLGEGESGNETPRGGPDFGFEVFADDQKSPAREGEADTGKKEDDGERSFEAVGVPVLVDRLDGRKGTAPKKRADQDRQKRAFM